MELFLQRVILKRRFCNDFSVVKLISVTTSVQRVIFSITALLELQLESNSASHSDREISDGNESNTPSLADPDLSDEETDDNNDVDGDKGVIDHIPVTENANSRR